MLKKNICIALLLAMGLVLHQLTPGTVGSMKFDLMLAFIFAAIFITKDFKSALLTGMLGGILTAMTTTFPGGQLPNILDKLVTCLVLFGMTKAFQKINYQITVPVLAFLGTLVSGTLFLSSALVLSGLPAPFSALFIGIVVPTAVTNIFITSIVYNSLKVVIKTSKLSFN